MSSPKTSRKKTSRKKKPAAAKVGSRRTCILVLGMHRSGTSALTRVLSLMGAALPKHVMGAHEGNSSGHWEPERLVAYHDAILAELNSGWQDWRPLDLGGLPDEPMRIRAHIHGIVEHEYGDAPLFVIKDPRICRFPGLFIEAMEERGIEVVPVIILRNPLDVIASLESRTVAWPEDYTAADAGLLWLTHVLEAEQVSRGCRRAIVSYDALMEDWRAAITAIGKQTGLQFPVGIDEAAPSVDEFLSPDLRHHAHEAGEVALDPHLRGWVSDVFEAVTKLAAGKEVKRAQATLDGVRSEFFRALPLLGVLISATAEMRDRARAQVEEERASIAAWETRARTFESRVMRMESSLSWKMTHPFRVVNKALVSFVPSLRLLPSLLRVGGGFMPAVRKAVRIAREEGIEGVVKRIHMARRIDGFHQPVEADGYRPLVSVIVPNYKHAEFLEQRLDSIYAQDYRNFEVILLDDVSPDNSLEILTRYRDKYPDKTRLVANEVNSGSGYRQWARGLTLANGELVWIAESDDWSDPSFLSSLVPCFADESVELAYVNSAFMDEKGAEEIWSTDAYLRDLGRNKWRKNFVQTAHDLVAGGWSIKNIVPNVSSAVFRRPHPDDAFLSGQWSEMKICGDWLFYLNVIKGGRVAYLPQKLNYYRIHGGSTAKATFKKDVYYKEHEAIARFVIANYEVPPEFIAVQEANLKTHWLQNRDDFSETAFESCYDRHRILDGKSAPRPRILMCGYAFSAGGGETFPVFLANLLRRKGYAVTFLSFEQEPREPGVRALLHKDVPVICNFRHLNKIVEEFGIDVIHSHHAWVDNTVLDILSPKSRARALVTMHGMYEGLPDGSREKIVRRLARDAAEIVFTADKNLKALKEFGLGDLPKVSRIPNALADTPFQPVARASLGVPETAFLLCLVSRAIPEKGWEEAIRAVEAARARSSRDIHLLLIGEGPEYDRLRAELSPDWVHYLGFRQNLRDYFATADMGLLPSRFSGESYPLVLIDCLATGTPIIASAIGEIPKMLDAGGLEAGALFELEDGQIPVSKLAGIISEFADDANRLEDVRQLTGDAYKKFDPSVMVSRYVDIYQRIFSAGAKR